VEGSRLARQVASLEARLEARAAECAPRRPRGREPVERCAWSRPSYCSRGCATALLITGGPALRRRGVRTALRRGPHLCVAPPHPPLPARCRELRREAKALRHDNARLLASAELAPGVARSLRKLAGKRRARQAARQAGAGPEARASAPGTTCA
jgi:hypothetical protein